MQTMLVSLLVAGIGIACCQGAAASSATTTKNERAILVSGTMTRMAFTAMAGRNSKVSQQKRGNKGKP